MRAQLGVQMLMCCWDDRDPTTNLRWNGLVGGGQGRMGDRGPKVGHAERLGESQNTTAGVNAVC